MKCSVRRVCELVGGVPDFWLRYGDLMGTVALNILSKPYSVDVSELPKIAKDNLGLLPQPAKPLFKTALVGIYVRSAPYGGSDKSSNGHRYDSIPFANGMINSGMSCEFAGAAELAAAASAGFQLAVI